MNGHVLLASPKDVKEEAYARLVIEVDVRVALSKNGTLPLQTPIVEPAQ